MIVRALASVVDVTDQDGSAPDNLRLPGDHTAWLWGALLAASIAGWLHQLTASPGLDGRLFGHGVRGGQAMIATLRHRLIRVPARLIRHARAIILRLPPGHDLLNEVLARIRALPAAS